MPGPPTTLAVASSAPTQLTDAVAAAARAMFVLYAGATLPAATAGAVQREGPVGRLTVFGGVGGVSSGAVAALRFA